MELLNVITARSVWLFDLPELNPRGKSVFPELFNWLKEAYGFEKAPASISDLDKETNALLFSHGRFQVKEEIFVEIVDLRIYNDGIVANGQSSTHETDAFLNDLLKSAVGEFSLSYRPEMIRRKMYLSELNVKSEKSLAAINPGLAELANKISSLMPNSVKIPFEFAGISFWPEQVNPPMTTPAFVFERKLNAPTAERKFYSKAPLQTDDHLRVLQEFESLFMD